MWNIFVDDWKTEPHYHHQTVDWSFYQTIKYLINNIIYHTSAPDYTWIVYCIHVLLLLNHKCDNQINTITITKETCSTADINPLLCFSFLPPVYSKSYDSNFPSDSTKTVVVGLVLHNMLHML